MSTLTRVGSFFHLRKDNIPCVNVFLIAPFSRFAPHPHPRLRPLTRLFPCLFTLLALFPGSSRDAPDGGRCRAVSHRHRCWRPRPRKRLATASKTSSPAIPAVTLRTAGIEHWGQRRWGQWPQRWWRRRQLWRWRWCGRQLRSNRHRKPEEWRRRCINAGGCGGVGCAGGDMERGGKESRSVAANWESERVGGVDVSVGGCSDDGRCCREEATG